MIIIIIIIQYFIQITHTDDFPSTGTRVALYKELTYEGSVLIYLRYAVCTCSTSLFEEM